MNVDAILRTKGTDVATTRPDATLADVAQVLSEKKIGALVASADGATVDGIVSERDIVRKIAEHGAAALNMSIGDAMTRDVVTCTRKDSLQDLMSTMSGRRIRHLPVVEDGQLCGMVSIGDVVKLRLEEVESEAEALRGFITGG
ncbi:MAG: CBS domain-containing protein [Alphaproteobacteria bacterium]